MEYKSFKRTAIHNLRVTSSVEDTRGISEGFVIPKSLMELTDILPYEQIIVTSMEGNNWKNRVYTFAIPGNEEIIEARGSVSHLLNPGGLLCLITRGYFDNQGLETYLSGQLPIVDLGFDPEEVYESNHNKVNLFLEYKDKKVPTEQIPSEVLNKRNKYSKRIMLFNLILGLQVNKTHKNCLQGSAELPQEIMDLAELIKYQSVFVYNTSKGGVVETYVVPTQQGIVMTTGAMAKFAPIGTKTSIAGYVVTQKQTSPKILRISNNSIDNVEILMNRNDKR